MRRQSGSRSVFLPGTAALCCSICAVAAFETRSWSRPDWHASLAGTSSRGGVMWPIRDSGRQVLGFGARRLFDDDRMPAKYINTPETLLYKKSHVLYGLELARTAISKKSQAVVVEGYTDVMAAHLSGCRHGGRVMRHRLR